MRSIINVFGRSPFVPLQMHMAKVAECINELPIIMEAYLTNDAGKVASLAEKISSLEHNADMLKHEIRNNLPRGLFMPVDRSKLLRILSLQDSIANRAENLAVLLTFKQANTFDSFEDSLLSLLKNSLDTFQFANQVIDDFDELLESGFGGVEAGRVLKLVDQVARKEYECDLCQRDVLRLLLKHEDLISYGDFFLWTRIIQQIGGIADRSDNLCAAVRETLDSN